MMASILGFLMLRERSINRKKMHRYHSAREPEVYKREGIGDYQREEGNKQDESGSG
jgi:hypothetical protein